MKIKHYISIVGLASACSLHADQVSAGIGIFGDSSNQTSGTGVLYGLMSGTGNTIGDYGIALGDSNYSDTSALAAGFNNIITSSWGAAGIGELNAATNSEGSVAIGGENTLVNEWRSVFLGSNNRSNYSAARGGTWNILIGYNNVLINHDLPLPNIVGNVILGSDNESSESTAWILGQGNIGQTNTVILGRFAAPVNDAALIVGNGTSSQRSNGLVVSNDGTVTIPSGDLILNGEFVLTPSAAQSVISSHLTSNNYLKRSYGSGSTLSGGGLLSIGDNSSATASNAIAVGYGTSAPASDTIAMGTGTWSNGTQSVSIGTQSGAFGMRNVVLGSHAYAYLQDAVAIGSDSTAVGMGSLAIVGATANGDCSFASNYSYADGLLSIAMGFGSASGYSSIAIGGFDENQGVANLATASSSAAIGGNYNQANGENSYAMGYQAISSASYSNAFGFLVKTKAAYEIALGSKNLSSGSLLTPQDSTTWRENEALFELGNGNPSLTSTEYSNAITTFKNGQTILTNKAWKQDADVTGTTENAQGEALVVEGHTRMEGNVHIKGKVVIDDPQGDISMGIYGN